MEPRHILVTLSLFSFTSVYCSRSASRYYRPWAADYETKSLFPQVSSSSIYHFASPPSRDRYGSWRIGDHHAFPYAPRWTSNSLNRNYPGSDSEREPFGPENSKLKPGQVSLVFVIDSTGSMHHEISQVREGIKAIFKTILEHPESSIHDFVLVPFNDPLVGPIMVTTDPKRFIWQLETIKVDGGGDCEEKSLKGLQLAITRSLPKSHVFVFTDAAAKDYHLLPQVETLIQKKESQVVFVLTGDCGSHNTPGYQAYERIAAMSFGQVFNLWKDEVHKVLQFVNYTIHERNEVNIMVDDAPGPGGKTYTVPVDSKTDSLTVSLSGKNPSIHMEDPNGNEVGGNPILDVHTGLVVNVNNPNTGNWSINVGSSSGHHVRMFGSSAFSFTYGFTNSTGILQMGSLQPVIGSSTFLLVKVTQQSQLHNLTKVNLRDQEVIKELHLYPVEGHPDLYRTTVFMPPTKQFYLEVLGMDSNGFPLRRLSQTAINPKTPVPDTEKEVNMKPASKFQVKVIPKKAFFLQGETFTLSCSAAGRGRVHLEWRKNGKLIQASDPRLEATAEASLRLHLRNADESDKGHYECTGRSNGDKDVGAADVVYVQAPTVSQVASNKIQSMENSTVTLTCGIEGKPKPKISWLRNGRKIKPGQDYQMLSNGDLSIPNAQVSSGGAFTCIGQNSLGQAQQTINLEVGAPPEIVLEPRDTDIPFNGSGFIPCNIDGSPKPDIVWQRLDGKEIDRTHITTGKTCALIFSDAKYEDRGVYVVTAQNKFGVVEIPVTVTISGVEPPSLSSNYQVTKIREGSTVSLPCYSSGYPPPDFRWLKDGSPIPGITENILTLKNVQKSESGTYKCLVSNLAGNVEKAFYVTVVGDSELKN